MYFFCGERARVQVALSEFRARTHRAARYHAHHVLDEAAQRAARHDRLARRREEFVRIAAAAAADEERGQRLKGKFDASVLRAVLAYIFAVETKALLLLHLVPVESLVERRGHDGLGQRHEVVGCARRLRRLGARRCAAVLSAITAASAVAALPAIAAALSAVAAALVPASAAIAAASFAAASRSAAFRLLIGGAPVLLFLFFLGDVPAESFGKFFSPIVCHRYPSSSGTTAL